jgi:hypothetical protein
MSETQDGCWGCKWFQEWEPKVKDDGISPRGQCNNLKITLGAHIPVWGAGCKHKEPIPHQENT